MVKKILKNCAFFLFPYRLNQKLIKNLIKWSYGISGDFVNGGELKAMKYVHKELINRYKSTSYVLFDVGANIGGYSLGLSKEFEDDANIYAFEPLGSTYELLRKNINSTPNISCYNLGFSNKRMTMPVYTNAEGSGMTSVYNRRLEHLNIDMDIKHDCMFSTIDLFCADNNINHIHFLKIDVEGHELAVMEGAKDMIGGGRIDFIQFEFGGCNIDSRTFFQDFWFLLHDNYTIYRILPNSLYKIDLYDETLEIFVCSNYLAVRNRL